MDQQTVETLLYIKPKSLMMWASYIAFKHGSTYSSHLTS